MVGRPWFIPLSLLHVRADELLRNIPVLVLGSSTAELPTFDDFFDWDSSVGCILLFCKSFADEHYILTIELIQGGIIGWCFDKYGPRTVMCIGSVVYIFSIMMTSLCQHYYQYLLSQGVLFGIGVGLM